jgi:hypothetical protein
MNEEEGVVVDRCIKTPVHMPVKLTKVQPLQMCSAPDTMVLGNEHGRAMCLAASERRKGRMVAIHQAKRQLPEEPTTIANTDHCQQGTH